MAIPHQAPRDPADPHGLHAHEHGHVILPMRLLLGTIIILLILTVLTVAASRLEIWIAELTGVPLPQWVNVGVALSIATVKSVLVLAIFMQLYFDKPINTAIFTSCILALALFLGFTMLDLGTRDLIHARNDGHVVTGGSGYGLTLPDATDPQGNTVSLSGLNPVQAARARAIAEVYGSEEALKHAALEHKGKTVTALPTADRAHARTGRTPGLFDEDAPLETQHGHDH